MCVCSHANEASVAQPRMLRDLLLLQAFPPIDLLLLQAFPPPSSVVLTPNTKDPHSEMEGVMGMVQNVSYKPLNSNIKGANELAVVGEKRVTEKICTETRGSNNVREEEGLLMDMKEHTEVGGGASGSSSIDINTSSEEAHSVPTSGCTGV